MFRLLEKQSIRDLFVALIEAEVTYIHEIVIRASVLVPFPEIDRLERLYSLSDANGKDLMI